MVSYLVMNIVGLLLISGQSVGKLYIAVAACCIGHQFCLAGQFCDQPKILRIFSGENLLNLKASCFSHKGKKSVTGFSRKAVKTPWSMTILNLAKKGMKSNSLFPKFLRTIFFSTIWQVLMFIDNELHALVKLVVFNAVLMAYDIILNCSWPRKIKRWF